MKPINPLISDVDLASLAELHSGNTLMGLAVRELKRRREAPGGKSAVNEAGIRVLAKLSPRRREILVRICEGKTNLIIAEELKITEQTVKNAVREILRITGRRCRTELTIFSFRNGIVACPCSHSAI